MALDMFLKIDGIPGESTADKHQDEIDVLSFSWSASNAATTSGGGTGKVQMQALQFTARSSQASPPFIQACAAGKHFKGAVFSLVRTVGDQGQDFMVWRLGQRPGMHLG